MNHAPCAVTPLNPELIQVSDAVGQRAQRRLWMPEIVSLTPDLGILHPN